MPTIRKRISPRKNSDYMRETHLRRTIVITKEVIFIALSYFSDSANKNGIVANFLNIFRRARDPPPPPPPHLSPIRRRTLRSRSIRNIHIFIAAIYWTMAQRSRNFSSNKTVVNTSRLRETRRARGEYVVIFFFRWREKERERRRGKKREARAIVSTNITLDITAIDITLQCGSSRLFHCKMQLHRDLSNRDTMSEEENV